MRVIPSAPFRLFLAAAIITVAGVTGCAVIKPTGSPLAQRQTISQATAAAEKAREAAAKARDAAELARNLPTSKQKVLPITVGTAAQRAEQKDKLSYVGESLNEKAHGYGRLLITEPGIHEGKYIYEGEFRNHQIHGYGVQYSLFSNERYEGEFRTGKHTGFGATILGDEKRYAGDQYHGEWRDDVRQGYGIYYKRNGEAHYGYWSGGREPDAKKYAIRKGVFAPCRGNIDCFREDRKSTKAEYDRLKGKKSVTASRSNQTDRNFERAKAEYDRLKNKKTVTARKTTASSGKIYRQLYCRNEATGYEQELRSYRCPVGDYEITKAEFDRLKGKKTVTASKMTTTLSKPTYCKTADGAAYKHYSPYGACGGFNEEITKAEYDRLRGEEKDRSSRLASTSSSNSEYCKQSDGLVYQRHSTQMNCMPDSEIIKAEYDRLKGKKTTVANKKPKPKAPAPKLDVLDAPYLTLKNANVRERPDIESTRVATLSKGSEVTALGKVKGKNWYLVSRDGKKLGYVFGTLLSELETEPETRVAAAPEVIQAIRAPENKDAVAVIIGNKNYANAHYNVAYAHNDADAIREFVKKRLGYRDGNIIDLRDATVGDFMSVFGTDKSHEGKLFDWVRAGQSDVIVYYSGHGVPGLEDRRGYLLPVDGDPNRARLTGYPLELLLDNLAKIPARSITVYLDACFSGGSHRGMLVRSASPILVTPKDVEGTQRMVVLTAASGDQLASWDEDKKHGLFTWHLLEALSGTADRGSYGNGNGEVVVSEVKRYLDAEMTYQARRRYGREQNVWISGEMDRVLVSLNDAVPVAEEPVVAKKREKAAPEKLP